MKKLALDPNTLIEGQEYFLKDSNILDDNQLDFLENQEIQTQQKLLLRQQQQFQKKAIENRQNYSTEILGKYDDLEEKYKGRYQALGDYQKTKYQLPEKNMQDAEKVYKIQESYQKPSKKFKLKKRAASIQGSDDELDFSHLKSKGTNLKIEESDEKQSNFKKALFKRKEKQKRVQQQFDFKEPVIIHQEADETPKFRFKQCKKQKTDGDFLQKYSQQETENIFENVEIIDKKIQGEEIMDTIDFDANLTNIIREATETQKEEVVKPKKVQEVVSQNYENNSENFSKPGPQPIISAEEELKEILDDTIVGKGLFNALKYFSDRGMLGNDSKFPVSTDIIVGRNKDTTLSKQLREHGMDQTQEKDRVKIQYRDKQGNELTIKQAFREFCWKFHGKMPSHKQQEKQQRQIDSQKAIFKQPGAKPVPGVKPVPGLKKGPLAKINKLNVK